MVLAIGIHIADFPPTPNAIGNSPLTVVIEVSRIGRRRIRPALIIARHLPTPDIR